jgi:DNA replication and repair protein RecF
MRIHRLQLQQFRSYTQLDFLADSNDVHVFYGSNGAGKTNILEALHILSLSRTCFAVEESELITWGNEWYRITADIINGEQESIELEVVYQVAPRTKKALFVNGLNVQARTLVGHMPTITFLPEHLELFTGPPGRRRIYIDQILCQVSAEYLQSLSDYQKILKQRNALLKAIAKGNAHVSQLVIWNEAIAPLAAYITHERLNLLQLWQCTIESEVQQLGERWQDVRLHYTRKTISSTKEDLHAELLEHLHQAAQKDVLLTTTSVGPHRDDWSLYINERSITSFASRGQQRTAIIALLFLETSYIELQRNERPIVLLDDVFSELDVHHQESLLGALQDTQVFITTAHEPPIKPNTTYWHVHKGVITPC